MNRADAWRVVELRRHLDDSGTQRARSAAINIQRILAKNLPDIRENVADFVFYSRIAAEADAVLNPWTRWV